MVSRQCRTRPVLTMPAVHPCEVPPNSLLRQYSGGGGFADCYVAEVAGSISQQSFVAAFYTTPLFKIERALLKVFAARPASDADAERLSRGEAGGFSAWRVEGQSPSELLLADMTGRTRSWLMAAPVAESARAPRTRLYFGSAVVPRVAADGTTRGMGWAFHALLGFHRLYSHALLLAASKRLQPA
jgi:hypothetical protein